MNPRILAMILTAMMVLTGTVRAQTSAADHAAHSPAPAATPRQSALADGEIRKVDRATRKITLRHGPIPSLDMPPMTMVYQVKDPALLDKVKVGDKVRFAAEAAGGSYVVTRLEKVQ